VNWCRDNILVDAPVVMKVNQPSGASALTCHNFKVSVIVAVSVDDKNQRVFTCLYYRSDHSSFAPLYVSDVVSAFYKEGAAEAPDAGAECKHEEVFEPPF
jgi:hypothetical protein